MRRRTASTTPIDYNNAGEASAGAQRLDRQPAQYRHRPPTARCRPGTPAATTPRPSKVPAQQKLPGRREAARGGPAGLLHPDYRPQRAAATPISVVKAVTGDTVRRTVVDKAKCANCHEWFEGHGGNRVYQTQVCVMCHVPGLATSGRGISDAALAAYDVHGRATTRSSTDWKLRQDRANAALKFPVTTNNFKDMIHGIHSGRERVTPFLDARDRTPSCDHAARLPQNGLPGHAEQLRNLPRCRHLQQCALERAGIDLRVDRRRLRGRNRGGTATPAMPRPP